MKLTKAEIITKNYLTNSKYSFAALPPYLIFSASRLLSLIKHEASLFLSVSPKVMEMNHERMI
jgi:hypothetical protein